MADKIGILFFRVVAWSAVALALLIGVWFAVSYAEYDVCLPAVMNRLGIQGKYPELVSYSRSLLSTGNTPEQVETALTTVGAVRVTSERSYAGQTLRTYSVSVCWTPLTTLQMGTAFDRNDHLVSANPDGVD